MEVLPCCSCFLATVLQQQITVSSCDLRPCDRGLPAKDVLLPDDTESVQAVCSGPGNQDQPWTGGLGYNAGPGVQLSDKAQLPDHASLSTGLHI